jgi:hypothetical protein
MPEKCPVCGGDLQATRVVEHYFTLSEGFWEKRGTEVMEDRYYCENDHLLDADAVSKKLAATEDLS